MQKSSHLQTKTFPILSHHQHYQTQVWETGTDKAGPWAQVSSFVTLFSEREEVFPLLFSKHNYFKITVKQADREPNISSGTHWNVSQVQIKRGLSCSVVCVSNFERNNFPLLSGKSQFSWHRTGTFKLCNEKVKAKEKHFHKSATTCFFYTQEIWKNQS